jgi:gluconolactonase
VSDAGIPDGIKLDVHGRIYTGCADGVHVLSPCGCLLGKIRVHGCEGGVANLCFGEGRHGSTLFLLAEGAIIGVTLHGTSGALADSRSRERFKRAVDRLCVPPAWCGVL